MNVKLQLVHPDAVVPKYAKEGDACMDLTAVAVNESEKHIEYDFGIAVEIPNGFFGYIRPRSSVSNTDLTFKTSGIIDSGYRGTLRARFQKNGEKIYQIGERAAQLIILPYPSIEFDVVDELSKTERGEGGHGSTN